MTKTVRSITDIPQAALDAFSCGEEKLDSYVQKHAKKNHKSGVGKTFVLVNEDGLVLGFYTISMASIEFNDLPEKLKKGMPRYPVPTARIGRLAIDLKYQGKKLGGALLLDALKRIHEACQSVAAFAVIVDAKNDKAKAFYSHYEFESYADDPLALFLPMSTINSLFETAS
ncbi:MAG: GNAT family N-acetyltransferase [Verrucomicrobia bacterium]|nr:GNAT family N-acetyltransferase [Verrucomicrobiota bacterium]